MRKRLTASRFSALALGLVLWVWMSLGLGGDSALWQEEEERFRLGMRLFPACVGAQEALEKKRSGDGSLHILVAYDGDDRTARKAMLNLAEIGQIRGLPVRLDAVSAAALENVPDALVAGIFVANPELSGERLRSWSEHYSALVFSPFTGAVENGAVAGIYVSDRILPYINVAQAKRAQIRFKPFFMQVARRHE